MTDKDLGSESGIDVAWKQKRSMRQGSEWAFSWLERSLIKPVGTESGASV